MNNTLRSRSIPAIATLFVLIGLLFVMLVNAPAYAEPNKPLHPVDKQETSGQSADTCTIHFDANGGDGEMADQVVHNDEQVLGENQFTHTGYVFEGWSNSPFGSITFEDGDTVRNMPARYKGSATLYAHWRPVTAQVMQYPDRYAINNNDVGMFYVIRTNEGAVIVIDGGNSGNADYVREVIAGLGNHVDAWIITHQHCDHVNAFNEIFADPGDMVIDHIYSNYVPNEDWNRFGDNQSDPRDIPAHARFNELVEGIDNITWLHAGDEFNIGGLGFTVYAAYDESLSQYYGNGQANISSLVFKVSAAHSSMLFCGDLRTDEMCSYLTDTYGDELQANYYQIGHHGNSSVSNDFIDSVSPSVVFFDCPEWLFYSGQHDTQSHWAYCRSTGALCYRWATNTPNTVLLY